MRSLVNLAAIITIWGGICYWIEHDVQNNIVSVVFFVLATVWALYAWYEAIRRLDKRLEGDSNE